MKADVEIVQKRELNFDDWTHRGALERDIERLITRDTIVWCDGVPIIYYGKLENAELETLRKGLSEIEFHESTRTGGLKTRSRVFGYQPRVTLRRDYCTATSLAREAPGVNDEIVRLGKVATEEYAKWFPAVLQEHVETTREKVLPEWCIEGTPFTSGIVNWNNPLKYHFDSGNFKDVKSCMVALKKGVRGGYLACPEYGVGFEIADGSILIFDGQSILHGVTPIEKIEPRAHRFTLVFYTLTQMWRCEPLDRELARIRNLKTKRERKRANVTPV